MISFVFEEILYKPLFNILIAFYAVTGDLGIAIILLTVLVKIILHPLSKKQLQSQQKMKDVAPEINKIKEKHKDDKEAQSREMMSLYKEKGVNPASGCLPLLIQLPILIALYRVFLPGNALLVNGAELHVAKDFLYNIAFLQNIDLVNNTFLGFVDLTKRSIPLAFVSALLQFAQSKTMMNKSKDQTKKKEKEEEKGEKSKDQRSPDFQDVLNSQMLYVMPAVSFFIGLSFPAGLPLYWSASTLITLIQQRLLKKTSSK